MGAGVCGPCLLPPGTFQPIPPSCVLPSGGALSPCFFLPHCQQASSAWQVCFLWPCLGAPSPPWHDLEGKKTRAPPSDERLPGVVVYFLAMLLFLLALFGVDIFKLVLRISLPLQTEDRGHNVSVIALRLVSWSVVPGGNSEVPFPLRTGRR